MARADLLVALARASAKGDHASFCRTLEAIVAEERANNHDIVADRLAGVLSEARTNGNGTAGLVSDSPASRFCQTTTPRHTFEDLILSDTVEKACRELVEEQSRCKLLRSHGFEPRHRVLLIGPPGNGKTSLAEAIADALMVPLLAARYEGLIASYLGETANRLARLFDHVRTRQCVLFFDEFDTLGKERGDTHETGEIKRVVSSLLLAVDDLPSHVVVIAATNHPELLDRAVWRRFQLRLELPKPTRAQATAWFDLFASRSSVDLGYAPRTFADKLQGLSFGELEDFALDLARRAILSGPDGNPRDIARERLAQWSARAGSD